MQGVSRHGSWHVYDKIDELDIGTSQMEPFCRWVFIEKGLFDEMPGIRGLDDKLPDIAAANINKLGLLDPALSCDVLSLYTNLRGIKIDLIELSSGDV